MRKPLLLGGLVGMLLLLGTGFALAATPNQNTPTNQLQLGEVQGQLRALGYLSGGVTWRLDLPTKQALEKFQTDWHLTVTGKPDASTIQALNNDLNLHFNLVQGPLDQSNLTIGDLGASVRTLQQDLQSLGFNPGPADGVFMHTTGQALMRFQVAHHLQVTEVLDRGTYDMLEGWLQNPQQAAAAPSTAQTQTATTATSANYEAGLQVVKVLHMTATAYGPSYQNNYPYGPVDYFGAPLQAGMVAVDPSVIPLGSQVYVSGYNFNGLPVGGFLGVAADTGGAIVGNRLDIFINASNSYVRNFGIQQVKVYVLRK